MLTAQQLRQAAALSGAARKGINPLAGGRFRSRIEGGSDYDLMDLRNLLRKDQSPDLTGMIERVLGNFQFLGQMLEIERTLAADAAHRQRPLADALVAALAAV